MLYSVVLTNFMRVFCSYLPNILYFRSAIAQNLMSQLSVLRQKNKQLIKNLSIKTFSKL